MRVVLASSNKGKLRELASLLAPLGFDIVAQNTLGIDTPPELGTRSPPTRYSRHAMQQPQQISPLWQTILESRWTL